MSATASLAGPSPILIDRAQAAALLGISESMLDVLRGEGRLPEPVQLRSSVRWRYAELVAWADSGCPSLEEWMKIQRQR